MPTFNKRLAGTAAATLITSFCAAAGPQLAVANASTCAHANTPVAAATRGQMRRAVVCLVNKQRVSRGLPRLRRNRRLNRSAQGWTNTMVNQNVFTHGSNFSARISAVGFNWSIAGENIATGFETPRQVVAAWMASTGHCQNILNPDFSRVGTGVVNRGVSGYGGAATWTQDFALRMGAPPPSRNFGPQRGCPYRI